MGQLINMPWVSREINVIGSTDPTLVGLSGMVIDETKRTIHIQAEDREITMAKDTITFTIEDEEIVGSAVRQRPEERLAKMYRRS